MLIIIGAQWVNPGSCPFLLAPAFMCLLVYKNVQCCTIFFLLLLPLIGILLLTLYFPTSPSFPIPFSASFLFSWDSVVSSLLT